MQTYLFWIYLGLVVTLSLVSFLAYGFDKRRAERGGRRVPERTLHLLAVCGGWPGGLCAQRYFRHKTLKASFRLIFWTLVTLHVGLSAALAYAVYGRG